MPSYFELADQWRKRINAVEAGAAGDLVDSYRLVWDQLKKDLRIITLRIKEAREAGEDVNEAWLFQQNRLESLEAQIIERLGIYTQAAGTAVEELEVEMMGLGEARLNALTAKAGVRATFSALPASQLEMLVGTLADGTPLNAVLQRLGPMAAERVRDSLIKGVALGWNPRKMEREARDVAGQVLSSVLRIHRTEGLRVFREYNHYQRNQRPDVISGWYWLSAADGRTCLSCWAMHGTFHRNDERLDDHPNGRCTDVPAVRGVDVSFPTGVDRLNAMKEAEKRNPGSTDLSKVMSKAKYEAFMEDKVAIGDFVTRKRSSIWGTTRREASLASIS